VQVFCHRIRKYLGAYAAVMGGVDVIIFTGGIGENKALIRQRAMQHLEFLGVAMDEDLNRQVQLNAEFPVVEISPANSRCRLLVVAADEEGLIAEQTMQLFCAVDRP